MAGLLDYVSGIVDKAGSNVRGLLSDPIQMAGNIIDQLAQRAAAQQAATKAAWATGDPKVMAQNALDSSQTALGFAPLGITAWHGSPHTFDKFSLDKIGTGEGAQAYGHGLYLAEKPNIAAGYRDRLSTNYVDASGAQKTAGSAWTDAMQAAQDAGAKHPDHARAIAGQVQAWVDSGKQAKTFLRYNQPPQGTEAQYKAAADALEGLAKNPGNLYKTDIPEEAVARFLDWDKPLSQQAPEVQAGLSKALAKRPGMTGAELYNVFGGSGALRQDLNTNFGFGKQASETLKELGIPGIRYLDGGSRSAGQGSSNFVVFDPELIRILERNGQATGNIPWQPGEWRGLLGNN